MEVKKTMMCAFLISLSVISLGNALEKDEIIFMLTTKII